MKCVIRAAFSAATFLVGLLLTCWLIRINLPIPKVPAVQAKLEHLSSHANEYDTLFLGSSRIYHQIIPSRFDELMAQRGVPTRSFNCGVDGMRPPEDAYVLDRILSYQPKNLRWVIVELAYLRMPVDKDKRGTIRAVYWHDWERLALLARRAFTDTKRRDLGDRLRRLQEPLADLVDHVSLFIKNTANIGRGELLTHFLKKKRAAPIYWPPLGEKKDGFVITGRPEEILNENRIPFERELASRQQSPARRDEGDPVSQLALARILEKIRSVGATPILVVPPTTSKKNFVPAPELGGDLVVLDFSDVQKHAVLYENRYRLDTDHVNTAGAEVFTALFVDAFASAVLGRNE